MTKPIFHTKDDLAERFGLSLSRINDYISMELLQPIKSGDATVFTSRAVLTIEIIQKGASLGFTLYEIKRLIDAHSAG